MGSLPPTHADALASFNLEAVLAGFHGDMERGINACVECCDRYAEGGGTALTWVGKDGSSATLTFADLKAKAAQFAGVLRDRGVVPGDRVSGLLPRIPELLITILGTWRAGAVYQPLFTAFGPKAIEHRVHAARSRLVVTDGANRAKLDDVRDCPPVLLVGAPDHRRPGDGAFWPELEAAATDGDPVPRRGDDLMMLMFTSGTTGPPKQVPVPLRALASIAVYMRDGIDLRPSDRFWNIADPGWAYGLYYTVTGPLLLGRGTLFNEAGFTAEGTCQVIRAHGITNLAGAPTAYRLLMAAGPEAVAAIKGRLRVVSSAGEPLNPEVIRWFADHLGCPIKDHYGQTETGMVVNNHHGLDQPVHPGAAGLPMPGFRVAVLGPDHRELPPGRPGILAVDRRRSPLMWFPGYLDQATAAFVGDYYLTGDTVQENADGSIGFVGRSDDIITSAGYRIGPFDVESALIEHPAVVEAAVIGVPDPERTEIVKAFVVLAKGHAGGPTLAHELQELVRKRLSAHAYPRLVEFVTDLPKTPSGKIQRFILRQGAGSTRG